MFISILIYVVLVIILAGLVFLMWLSKEDPLEAMKQRTRALEWYEKEFTKRKGGRGV
jgi:hypothetical protein